MIAEAKATGTEAEQILRGLYNRQSLHPGKCKRCSKRVWLYGVSDLSFGNAEIFSRIQRSYLGRLLNKGLREVS